MIVTSPSTSFLGFKVIVSYESKVIDYGVYKLVAVSGVAFTLF